jgi:mRNA interferase MazF
VTFRPFDVLAVPFPFTDSAAVKRRPAVVLAAGPFNDRIGHLVLAMITSRENRGCWQGKQGPCNRPPEAG